MKVLHITNHLDVGGAEKLLADSLPLYKELEVDADLMLLSSGDFAFLPQLKKSFGGHIFFAKTKNIYSPLQILDIRKVLKQGYDVVHVHLFPGMYWTVMARLLLRSKVPLVITEHNTKNRRLDSAFFRMLDRFIYKKYHKIISITPPVKDMLVEELNIFNEKITVIYNGIDLSAFAHSESGKSTELFEDDSTVLIQVSRFHAQKDQATVIKALAILPEQYKLILVGDGETKADCEQQVEELGLQHRVRFLGARTDIPQLLHSADIVIQSSHWEGFGLAAVEGMAAEKPVVASRVAGLQEIVEGYGLTFESGNANELADKVLSLSEDDEYRKIAVQCLERSKSFGIKNMVVDYVKIYEDSIINSDHFL